MKIQFCQPRTALSELSRQRHIFQSNNSPSCSGYDYTNYQILAGQTDIRMTMGLVQALWLAEHPEYDDWELWNDIVVIRLTQSLTFSDSIRAKFLPVPNFNVPAGSRAVISGWGDLAYGSRNFPDILQSVEVPVLSNAQCQAIYDQEEILPQHLCAGQTGSDA
jgi:hypothetical protein